MAIWYAQQSSTNIDRGATYYVRQQRDGLRFPLRSRSAESCRVGSSGDPPRCGCCEARNRTRFGCKFQVSS